MDWITDNSEWIFSGIGVFVIGLFLTKLIGSDNMENSNNISNNNNTENSNNISNNDNTIINNNINMGMSENGETKLFKTVTEAQNNIKILFIDDDTKFKVVNILKNSGWKNTRIIKDVSNLNSSGIKETDIFFVDIQGVGKKLSFQDEGLGLANALKDKYKNKKIVIYSTVSSGDRFHEALNKADGRLSKNADPFQFQQLIESLSVD